MFLRGPAPLPWLSWNLMWMFYEDLQMLLYLSGINSFILLQVWPQLNLLSTGSTQEGQSQHDWKTVDWNLKNDNKTFNCFICYRYDLSLIYLVLVQPRKASPNMTEKTVDWNLKNDNKTFNCFILLQIWPQLNLLSTGSTQEGQSQQDWKTVDWDIKN